MNKLEHLLIIDIQAFPIFNPRKLHPFTDKTLSPYSIPQVILVIKDQTRQRTNSRPGKIGDILQKSLLNRAHICLLQCITMSNWGNQATNSVEKNHVPARAAFSPINLSEIF
jgi:hypothetical protein